MRQRPVSWRVGTDFKPTDRILLYGNIAKGYKAGSFPTVPGLFPDQFDELMVQVRQIATVVGRTVPAIGMREPAAASK